MASEWHECGVVHTKSDLSKLLGEVERMDCYNYINGRWVPATGGRTFDSVDPANGEIVGKVPLSSSVDVEMAVEAAAKAFKSWRLLPAPKRGEILFRVGQILQQKKEALAQLITREMGKVIAEARGDVQEAIDMTFYMAGEGRRLFGHTVPAELQNKHAMSMRDPIGVVAAITPWNFPIAIPSWKLAAALICGNTVVLKPASDTPVTAIELVKIYDEAGMPEGVLNYLLRCEPINADSSRGDLWANVGDYRRGFSRRGHRGEQRHQIRSFIIHLFA